MRKREGESRVSFAQILIIGAFQLVIQPVLCLSTDGGCCGQSFAEATTSYTESCLHLMLRVLMFQVCRWGRSFVIAHDAGCDGVWRSRQERNDERDGM